MNCLSDARSAASTYLRKSAKLLDDSATGHLVRAADLYQQEAEFTRSAIDSNELFFPPFSGKREGDWTEAIRKREREMLVRCEKVEAEAIVEMERAIAAAVK